METLLIFALALIASMLLAIPEQPVRLLGAEIAGQVSGLYWLVAAMILALSGGVASAWLFLMGTSH